MSALNQIARSDASPTILAGQPVWIPKEAIPPLAQQPELESTL